MYKNCDYIICFLAGGGAFFVILTLKCYSYPIDKSTGANIEGLG